MQRSKSKNSFRFERIFFSFLFLFFFLSSSWSFSFLVLLCAAPALPPICCLAKVSRKTTSIKEQTPKLWKNRFCFVLFVLFFFFIDVHVFLCRTTKVVKLVSAAKLIPDALVESEVNWFFNELGIEASYFLTVAPKKLAEHVLAIFGAKGEEEKESKEKKRNKRKKRKERNKRKKEKERKAT